MHPNYPQERCGFRCGPPPGAQAIVRSTQWLARACRCEKSASRPAAEQGVGWRKLAMVRISISAMILLPIGLSANAQTSPAEFRGRLGTFVGSWTVLGSRATVQRVR